MSREEIVEKIDHEFGGEIKVQHMNNTKFIQVEAHLYAERIKQAISCLKQHLEEKQEKRKKGLSALIRITYCFK